MKRFFDFAVSFIALFFLTPVFLLIIFLVWLDVGRPVFFVQMRPGLEGRAFAMFKFRTMTNRCGSDGALLPDMERLTRFGRFLRNTSLDELPELFNVLRGEMSLVGPRPLLMDYLCLYTELQARRHEVRPGITGWAQVNGRNSISWDEKFKLDLWYVDHRSFWLDMKILCLTLIRVVQRDGINSNSEVTVSRFEGKR